MADSFVLERRLGRPPRTGTPARRRIEFVVDDEEYHNAHRVARETGQKLANVIREAVNEYVADFGERQVFQRRKVNRFR